MFNANKTFVLYVFVFARIYKDELMRFQGRGGKVEVFFSKLFASLLKNGSTVAVLKLPQDN